MPEEMTQTKRRASGHIGIREVAERAGVGKTTAAYILNSEKANRFSEDTRKRVHEAAHELGYVPNIFARGLKTGKSALIGIYFGDFGAPDLRSGGWNTFFVHFFGGLCGAALERGMFPVTLLRGPDYPEGDMQRLATMMRSGIGGMVTYRAIDRVADYLLRETSTEFPLISIFGGFPKDAPVINIDVDNAAIGRMATEHLIQAGYRRIAAAVDAPNEESSILRYQGYETTMRAAGLEPCKIIVPEMIEAPDAATIRKKDEDTQRALRQVDADAFFCVAAGSSTLLGRALLELGRPYPETTALVGVDVILAPNSLPFTQFTAPWAEIAEKAVSVLEQCMAGVPINRCEQILIPPSFHQGRTTPTPGLVQEIPPVIHYQDAGGTRFIPRSLPDEALVDVDEQIVPAAAASNE